MLKELKKLLKRTKRAEVAVDTSKTDAPSIGSIHGDKTILTKAGMIRRIDSLQCLDDKLKTKELCKLVVETCELVVENNGYSLQYIPDKFKTKKMCEIAVKKDIVNFHYVPDKFKTKKMCEIAVKKDKYNPCHLLNKFKKYFKQTK